jgi:D-3-phosphoglycerate dehydrogenase
MKKNACIVNTSRGEVWDEYAIADALQKNKIAFVATDVISNESNLNILKDNPLMKLQYEGYPVVLTPHIAGATYESMHATEMFMAKKFYSLIKSTSNVRH